MTTALTITPSTALLPATLFTPTPKAARRVLEFFTAQINNDHTRRAYWNATRRYTSPRTTKLYDRRSDEISLDEVEKIAI
jgi:hypothetical protein